MSEPRIETPPSDGPSPRRPRDPWVRFACPHCGKRNKVDAMAIGRRAACARCGQPVSVVAVDRSATPGPVMRSVDPPTNDVTASPEVEPPPTLASVVHRPPFRLPTWVMVVLHASVTLGTVAAIWLLHAHGYLPGFNVARR